MYQFLSSIFSFIMEAFLLHFSQNQVSIATNTFLNNFSRLIGKVKFQLQSLPCIHSSNYYQRLLIW